MGVLYQKAIHVLPIFRDPKIPKVELDTKSLIGRWWAAGSAPGDGSGGQMDIQCPFDTYSPLGEFTFFDIKYISLYTSGAVGGAYLQFYVIPWEDLTDQVIYARIYNFPVGGSYIYYANNELPDFLFRVSPIGNNSTIRIVMPNVAVNYIFSMGGWLRDERYL